MLLTLHGYLKGVLKRDVNKKIFWGQCSMSNRRHRIKINNLDI